MSRVHDALRRAAQMGQVDLRTTPEDRQDPNGIPPDPVSVVLEDPAAYLDLSVNGRSAIPQQIEIEGFLEKVQEIPFQVAPESHLIDLDRLNEMPGEEFRSLRTRLNHIQGQQNIHSVVVTSASPAEGKTFTAANLAMAQAQLAENAVLLADFDLRRPVIHNLFQTERAPGLSDYLLDGVP